MTAYAGSSPEGHRDLTRPDLRLPQSPGSTPVPPPLQPPVPPPATVPDRAPAAGGQNWHRFHYPIGAFLVAYGFAGFATALIGWGDRRAELAGYIGSGLATPVLAAVKMVELVLVVLVLAGVVRRRDVWFLPALAGWLVGFGVFAVLDVVKGKWGGLLEHAVYLAAFALLLFLSYGLSVKARVGRAAKPEAAPPVQPGQPGQPGQPVPPMQPVAGAVPAPSPVPAPVPVPVAAPGQPLTRTQEFALATLNRVQEAARSATGGHALPWNHQQAPAPAPAPSPAPAPVRDVASETVMDVQPPQNAHAQQTAQAPQDAQATQAFEPPKPPARPPADATRPMPLPETPERRDGQGAP
ncbi:hypothetical protein [Actinomadura sp. 9N407]|uniref:hypothetical protein n=1 Tax=Actinomadura sp. 9N407 TaxID=3375154 RepID=UPI0037A2ED64